MAVLVEGLYAAFRWYSWMRPPRRSRRTIDPVAEVEVDGGRPGIEAGIGQLLSQGHDLVLVEIGDSRRRGLGTPASGLEPCRTLQSVAAEQLEEPARMHIMGPGQLLDRFARSQVHLDEKPTHVHRRPSSVAVSYDAPMVRQVLDGSLSRRRKSSRAT